MYEKALQIEMACVVGSHTDLAVTLNNVGEVYAKPDRGSEAMLMYEEAQYSPTGHGNSKKMISWAT